MKVETLLLNTQKREIRVIFPLLLRADGKPRKRQIPVTCGMNGACLCIKRGVVVEVPAWVPDVCETGPQDRFECFVSRRMPV
ncbi:MAG: hypothetical protein PHR35_08625 [Kiritimatiellae bacterium]|nr:hypothetical protein [Kiritimatiellia bacterium]